MAFLDSSTGCKKPHWAVPWQTELGTGLKNVIRLYTPEGMNSKGLHLRRGVLFDGVRVDLGNNNCIDIKSGMKPAGEFGRFVMGVFAPTAEDDPFFDTASPGVYPIYGNISSLKAEIRFGPNLFGLSKQDRSAMIKTKWEWMDDNSVRRRCNVARIAFQKAHLEIVPKPPRVDKRGRNMSNMGLITNGDGVGVELAGAARKQQTYLAKVKMALRRRISKLKSDQLHLPVSQHTWCRGPISNQRGPYKAGPLPSFLFLIDAVPPSEAICWRY